MFHKVPGLSESSEGVAFHQRLRNRPHGIFSLTHFLQSAGQQQMNTVRRHDAVYEPQRPVDQIIIIIIIIIIIMRRDERF